jgi:hypothetical protein
MRAEDTVQSAIMVSKVLDKPRFDRDGQLLGCRTRAIGSAVHDIAQFVEKALMIGLVRPELIVVGLAHLFFL